MNTVKEVVHVLGYSHTPWHVPAGVYIFGGLFIVWLFFLRKGRMTFGELCTALGVLGVGAGAVIWALRWKPAVVNNATTTYPTVNHAVTKTVTVVQHPGLAAWQEVLIAVVSAIVVAVIIRLFWMAVAGRWRG